MIRRLALLALITPALLVLAPSAWAASSYASTVLASPNLVSFWRLSEQGTQTDTEGMTAADATGANPGIYHLGVNLGAPGPLEGDPTTAAHFGTPDGYVAVPYNASLNAPAFSVEAWVNPDVGREGMVIASTGVQESDKDGYALQTYNNYGNYELSFQIGSGSNTLVLNGRDYTPGQWYYVVGTYDGTIARLYVDGQLTSSAITGYAPNTSYPLQLAVNPVITDTGQLQGSLADLAVYKAALSAATIQQHYQAGISDSLPPQTSLTSTPSEFTSQTTAVFQFTSNSVDPTYQCQLDEGAWQGCWSPYQVFGLSGGQHRFSVRAVDRAGLIDPNPPSVIWTVDDTPPITSFMSGPPLATNVDQATFSFDSKPGATYTCQLDDAPAVPCSSPYTVSGLPDGIHTLAVRATDSLGNVETTPAVYSWTVDTAPPTTFILQAPSARRPTLPIVFMANESGVTFRCQVDNRPWQACTSPFTGFSESAGTHTFRILATDAVGNVDPSDHLYMWTVARGSALHALIRFPKRISSAAKRCRGSRSCPRLSWSVSAQAHLFITVHDRRGRVLATAAVHMPTRIGSVPLPRTLLRRLKAGRYIAVLRATASGLAPAMVRAPFTVT